MYGYPNTSLARNYLCTGVADLCVSLAALGLYGALGAAGGFACDADAKDRAAKLIRILPPDRLDIGPDKLWPDYQRKLFNADVREAPPTVASQRFRARGDLATNDALGTK